jgi:NAD(P)-dependent dehydrogenase (short-subunit alcohol dehydrogenase family)
MHDFSGKIALITGAGKKNGIGFGIAKRLATDGAHVIISDVCRDIGVKDYAKIGCWEDLEALSRVINGSAVRLDVTDVASIEKAAAEIKEKFSHLDFLVNNAGAGPSPNLLQYMDLDMWKKTMDINLNGTLLVTRAMLPLMTRPGAAIVNTASRAGKRPRAFGGAYCVAKAAVIMLTKVFAIEAGMSGIRVNAICPGQIDTDLERWSFELQAKAFQKSVEEVIEEEKQTIPLKRLGLPEDVADIVAFLLSDDARYITGQAVNVDGGQLLEI